jgi:hypothetical protein
MRYNVLCTDAIDWLKSQSNHSLPHIIVSIPDWSEIEDSIKSLSSYVKWFQDTVKLIFKKLDKKSIVFFIQTDRQLKEPPIRISKAGIILKEALEQKINMLWHKVATQEINYLDKYTTRPTMTHLLAFSYSIPPLYHSSDVIPIGNRLWKHGAPTQAIIMIIDMLSKLYNKTKKNTKKDITIIDLFAGEGTAGFYALKAGFKVKAIEIDKEHCKNMEKLFEEVI